MGILRDIQFMQLPCFLSSWLKLSFFHLTELHELYFGVWTFQFLRDFSWFRALRCNPDDYESLKHIFHCLCWLPREHWIKLSLSSYLHDWIRCLEKPKVPEQELWKISFLWHNERFYNKELRSTFSYEFIARQTSWSFHTIEEINVDSKKIPYIILQPSLL